METKPILKLSDFSTHLFWEMDKETFDPTKNKRALFKRVMEYGLMSDFNLIRKFYGIDQIAEELKWVQSLEPKALHFIATISNSSLNDFKCYTRKQLSQKHWIY